MPKVFPENEFEARIKRLFEVTGARNDSDLARALGIKPQSIGPARKRQQVPPRWVEIIAKKYNASTDWLFNGTGKPFVDDPDAAAASDSCSCRHCGELKELLEAEQKERRAINAELVHTTASLRESMEANISLLRENGALKDRVHALEMEQARKMRASKQSAGHGRNKPVQSMPIVPKGKNTLQEPDEY